VRHSDGSGGSSDGGRRWVERRGACVQTGHKPPTMVKAGGSRPSEFRMVSLKSIVLSTTLHSGAPQGFSRSDDNGRSRPTWLERARISQVHRHPVPRGQARHFLPHCRGGPIHPSA
jgi:hypothetical protein